MIHRTLPTLFLYNITKNTFNNLYIDESEEMYKCKFFNEVFVDTNESNK